jgi:anti-sigma-K factor RskA
MKSWKTTLAGIAAIVAAVATAVSAQLDNDPGTVPDWTMVIAMITAGVGLVLARDNDKSSEQVGAGK